MSFLQNIFTTPFFLADVHLIDTIDYLVVPFYFLVFFLVLKHYIKKTTPNDSRLRKHLIRGAFLKLVFCILYSFINEFALGTGDVYSYFLTGVTLRDLLHNNFDLWWTAMTIDDPFELLGKFEVIDNIMFDKSNFYVPKIISCIYDMCAGSYIAMGMLLSTLCYLGIIKIVKVLYKYYKDNATIIFVAFLYMPTVLFWSSGLLKDTVSFLGITLVISSFIEIAIYKNKFIANAILFYIGYLLVTSVKSYIFYTSFPFLLVFWLFYYGYDKRNILFRFVVIPVTVFVGVYFIVFSSSFQSILEEIGQTLVVEKLVASGKGLATAAASSQFDIGIKYNEVTDFKSLLPYFWPAVNVTIFRPYLWEVKNIVQTLSSLESTGILLMSIIILIKSRVVGFVKILFKDPFFLFCLLFALCFTFLVGLSSSNFGTLARYKLPCYPFLIIMLLLINANFSKKAKAKNKAITTPTE